ncbi:MAG: hypothetical protein R2860_08195 [Desulfobacterales bacterium]
MSLQGAVRQAIVAKVLPDKVYRALKELIGLLDDIRLMVPDAAVREVMDRSDYLAYLQKYAKTGGDYTARVENLEQLIYSASQYSTLLEYLEDVSDRKIKMTMNPLKTVSLTMHASKGRDFTRSLWPGARESIASLEIQRLETDIRKERMMYVAAARRSTICCRPPLPHTGGQYNNVSRFISEISRKQIIFYCVCHKFCNKKRRNEQKQRRRFSCKRCQ